MQTQMQTFFKAIYCRSGRDSVWDFKTYELEDVKSLNAMSFVVSDDPKEEVILEGEPPMEKFEKYFSYSYLQPKYIEKIHLISPENVADCIDERTIILECETDNAVNYPSHGSSFYADTMRVVKKHSFLDLETYEMLIQYIDCDEEKRQEFIDGL